MFVVIEGPDGVGKTTLVKKLAKRLKSAGFKVRTTQEPFLPIKNILEIIGDIDAEEMYRLFIIDRAAHVNRVISRVPKDSIIISDRYWMSSYVYQGLMGVAEDRIVQDNLKFPQPDLVIFLMASPEVLINRIRGRGGKDVIETKVQMEHIVERYRKVAELCKRLGMKVIVIDNSGEEINGIVEDLYEEIVKML